MLPTTRLPTMLEPEAPAAEVTTTMAVGSAAATTDNQPERIVAALQPVVQEADSHADPRTTMRYDRARTSLDRHATYIVAAFIAGAAR
jgi:hypothetical protein